MALPNRQSRQLQSDDRYPSRIFPCPSVQQRQDPVVYGRGEPPVDTRLVEEYAHRGFIVLRSLFDEHEVEAMTAELDKVRYDKRLIGRPEAIPEKHGRSLRSLFRVHQLNELFARLSRDRRIVPLIEYLLGSEVYIHQSRLNFKPGFSGKDLYWHSDFETWHTEDGMPRMRALSVSIALTEAYEANGPMMFIPGSHLSYVACVGGTPREHYRYSLKEQEVGTPDRASLRHLVYEGGIEIPKGPPGTVILFDCNLMHGSNSNITPYPRGDVFFVYNSVENRMTAPYCGKAPRPDFIGARNNCTPVKSDPLVLPE